jgi:hypothetical protein
MTAQRKSDRMEAFRLMKRDRTLAKAEGIAGLAIADTCAMREGVCRKAIPTLAAEYKSSVRQIEYGLHGRRRKNGEWYFTGLLQKGIVFVIAGGRPEDGVPTTYGVNLELLRTRVNGAKTPPQTSAQTPAQNHSDPCTNGSEPLHNGADTPAQMNANPCTNADKVLKSSSVEGSNKDSSERESSESIPPAAATQNQSLSPSLDSCEQSSTENLSHEDEEQEQTRLGELEERRQWQIARDKRVQKTLDEIETRAQRYCGHDADGNEILDRPTFNQKGKELIRQALVKIENGSYDDNYLTTDLGVEGWPDDINNRGPELCWFDEEIEEIVRQFVESSDAFQLKNFSTNLGSSLYGALNQMYEAQQKAMTELRRQHMEKTTK